MVCYELDGSLFIPGTVNLAICVVKPIGVFLRDRFSAPKRASEGCVVLSPGDLPGQDRTGRLATQGHVTGPDWTARLGLHQHVTRHYHCCCNIQKHVEMNLDYFIVFENCELN